MPLSGRGRRRALLGQAASLPFTLVALHHIVRDDCSTAALDEHLWAFAAFHRGDADPHCHARTWQKAAFPAVHAGQAAGMSAIEFAFMLHVAMEIEEPTALYTRQTGEGFRILLPALGRFMGQANAEARATAERNGPWCVSPWCAEERRHAPALARLIERLTGATPRRDNPNTPVPVPATESEALALLAGRQSSEWNASSVYVVLAAHATGDLHAAMRNLARDEIKHLAILSAVDRYLMGPRPWARFRALVEVGIEQYRGHRQRRTSGRQIGANTVSAIEVIAAHLMEERAIRRWLRSLPLSALTAVFEAASRLPPLPASPPPPEQASADLEAARAGAERRETLARWVPRARQHALAQREWERAASAEVDRCASAMLGDLDAAGLPGTKDAARLWRRLGRLRPARLREAVRARLRVRQIFANQHVLAQQSPRHRMA